MLASARVFLEGIIDYAGLFPPAELPLEKALANYLHYRREPESWMLARFICPAARLKELLAFRADLAGPEPFRLTVLGRGGKDAREFSDHVRADLKDIVDFASQSMGINIPVEAYEIKLPAEIANITAPDLFTSYLSNLVGQVRQGFDRLSLPDPALFFEFPALNADFVRAALDRLQRDEFSVKEFLHDEHLHMQMSEESELCRLPCPGWKLRCGGLQAPAFPTPARIATVLAECCSAGIPWKATAGLHHPLRHFDAGLNTKMHGFVNVFGAGILIHARQITGAQIEEMLSDEDASHFAFDHSGFSWKNCQLSTNAIRLARRDFVTSFGSCSFDEPRDDLRALGWI